MLVYIVNALVLISFGLIIGGFLYVNHLRILGFYVLLVLRRTNELKSEIDIPEDVMKKFEQFWSDFKDTPLKGII